MWDWIWVKAVLKALILPPGGPLLLALAGLAMIGRHPRAGRRVAFAGVALLFALSIPAVGLMLTSLVDAASPFDPRTASNAQALVILGGGTRRDAPEYGGDTLGRYTLDRVRYGARVAKATALPVLVSGGSTYGGATEASLMRDALEKELGVPVRWAEDQSRTTYENAQFSARMLKAAGVARIVLVVHGADVPRAKAEFEEAGIAVIAAPTGLPPARLSGPLDYLPSVSGLEASWHALYEMAALAVRWMRVKL
jgi:uncharacterized SAM-binding protein YcdF (DUF218 family)